MKTIQSNLTMAFCAVALLVTSVSASTVSDKDLADHPWQDGLYSTITGAFVVPDAKPGCKEMKLKVPGFKKDLKVRASLRGGKAPLVVILNGTFGRADNNFANLWTAWLEEAGQHVLTFDSVMSKGFVEASRHGVPGNLDFEARLAGKVVEAFLQQSGARAKVSKIGVVGISYGGTLALQMARLDQEGALPFKLDAVRAYSAPVSFAESIRKLDGYYSFDFTKVELFKTFYNLPRELPVTRSFEARKMECALARAFREDLKEAIDFVDGTFDADLKRMGAPRIGLPTGDSPNLREERISYAEAMNFGHYFGGLVVPYWKSVDARNTAERLLGYGEMADVLAQTGSNVRAILAANDPLNADGSVAGLLKSSAADKVTVLPRGGHMGYFDAKWTRASLLGMFDGGMDGTGIALNR
ncbi:MAG: alpha/beta fold hydrolase [Planctomycetota bacterium]|nr:alpha/beta fold hydrolase [Planctomycetota bacterium]